MCVLGQFIHVEYSSGAAGGASFRSCSLSTGPDGAIAKFCSLHEKEKLVYIVENRDNTEFTLHRAYRDLLYFLHSY